MASTGPVSPEEIHQWCTLKGLAVELISHRAIGQTNEEAAKVLEVPLDSVLKSIVFQASPGGQFGVIQKGAKRIDLEKVRAALKVGKPALVPPGILKRSLGVEPGTVAPFLFAMRGIPAVVDRSVLGLEEVVASAGSSTKSLWFMPSAFEAIGYVIADVTEETGKR